MVKQKPPAPSQEQVKLKILYDFEGSTKFELSVSEDSIVGVLEDDDGSGWIKVSNGTAEGLIPTSYAVPLSEEIITSAESPKAQAPPVQQGTLSEESITSAESPKAQAPPVQQGSGIFVKVIYDYDAQGEDELSLKEGERLELSVRGKSLGDGQWWEGYNNHGRIGLFPSNYVEEIS